MPPFPMAGADVLNGPPPSPQLGGGGPTGGPPMSMGGLAGPAPPPTAGVPPEVATGISASARTIGELLNSYSQMLAQGAPDIAMQFGALADQLQTILAQLIVLGAGPTSPTNAGPSFPGGGIDRGIAGPGTV